MDTEKTLQIKILYLLRDTETGAIKPAKKPWWYAREIAEELGLSIQKTVYILETLITDGKIRNDSLFKLSGSDKAACYWRTS